MTAVTPTPTTSTSSSPVVTSATQPAPTRRFVATAAVDAGDLDRLATHEDDINAVAMSLTDAWGGAMFILRPAFVEKVFAALGFADEVTSRVYATVKAQKYVAHEQRGEDVTSQYTWHKMDATVLTLRGAVGLEQSLASVTDANIEALLEQSSDVFESLMEAMPEYTSDLMFKPEVAETVLATFGAKVTADRLYELGWKYGGQRSEDLEGRRGISTQFIRSLSLTLSATA